MFGNNYLKQPAFGARANSPVPIYRSSNCHGSECSMCARRIMLFLKVVMVVSNLPETYRLIANRNRTERPFGCVLIFGSFSVMFYICSIYDRVVLGDGSSRRGRRVGSPWATGLVAVGDGCSRRGRRVGSPWATGGVAVGDGSSRRGRRV